MPTINGKACVVNGKPVDKVYSNGKQVYGRNIAHGTTSDWQKVAVQSNNYGDWGVRLLCDPTYKIVDGENYTVRVEVRNATSPVMLELWSFYANGARDAPLAPAKPLHNDGEIVITFTAHLPNGYAYLQPNLAFTFPLNNEGSYEFRQFKIERGSTATPWTSAPEDVGVVV